MAKKSTAFDTIRRGLRLNPELRPVIGGLAISGILLGLGRVAIPILFQRIIDDGLLAEGGIDTSILNRLALTTTVVVLAVVLLSVTTQWVLLHVAERALAKLRRTVLRRAVDLSLAEHAVERQGDLVSRTTGDIELLTHFFDWGAFAWLVNLSIAATAAVAMFIYSWPLALIATVSLTAMVPILLTLQRSQQRRVAGWRERTADLLSDTTEAIAGGNVIRTFGQQGQTERRLTERVEECYDAQIHLNKVSAVIFPVSDAFGTIAISAVLLLAIGLGADGPGLGTTIAMLFLVQMILTPVAELTEVIDHTSLALAGWNRSIELAERPPAISSPTHPCPVGDGALGVTVEDVSFAYGDHTVLHHIDLSITAGSSVAMVGATGSGKTTMARLLCRLADPDTGVIWIGGVNLRHISDVDRRSLVRMVPQDGFLFATTVRSNILRGRDDATDADLSAAVSYLGLEGWVAQLPDGLDTVLGPAGEGLSVGERQLVALIRAAVADPGLLILDEATSSLDPATELAMSVALDRVQQGRTIITVAHRLSTAERCDTVLVFDQGRIVEHGTHQDLLALNGRYAALHHAWTRGLSGRA